MSFEGRVRGVHFTRVIKYVKKKRGIIGTRGFIEHINKTMALSPPYSEDRYQEKGWYNYEEYLDILEELDKFFGNGDGELAFDVGISTIKDLGILSFISRKPSLLEFMESAVKHYDQAYDFGNLEAQQEGEKRLVIRYHGFPERKVRCLYFKGSIQGMLEILDLEGTVEETICNSANGYCEYTVTWK